MDKYESVKTVPDNIIVTVGGSQALDIIAKIMLEPEGRGYSGEPVICKYITLLAPIWS